MNISEINVKEEWAYYNQVAPIRTARIAGSDYRYRYYKNEKSTKTIVVLAGGSGLSDGFFLFLRSLMDKYSLLCPFYEPYLKDNNATADAIAELVSQLKIDGAFFWGQSYGGLLAQLIALKHPNVAGGLLLTSTASFSNEITFEGMQCLVKMVNKEKEDAKVKKMQKMPFPLVRKMFPLMFKKHLKGDKKAYQTIKELIACLEDEISKELSIHMCHLLGDLRNHFGKYKKEQFDFLSGKVLIIEPDDDKTFTDDIKDALANNFINPKVIRKVEGGHLAIMFNPDGYIEIIDEFLSGL